MGGGGGGGGRKGRSGGGGGGSPKTPNEYDAAIAAANRDLDAAADKHGDLINRGAPDKDIKAALADKKAARAKRKDLEDKKRDLVNKLYAAHPGKDIRNMSQ